MKRTVGRIAAALVALAVLSFAATGQKTTNYGVTTTLFDNDSTGAQLLLRSDDYNGSQQATYTSMSTRGSSTSSTLDGELNLNLSNQSTRTLYVTPDSAINSQQPLGPAPGYYSQGTFMRVGCFDQNGNQVSLENVVTSSGNCKLGVDIVSGGATYKLLMSPFPLSGPNDPPVTCPSAGCPATGTVTVVCNAVSSGQCVNWTITANSTAANASVANLYRYSSSGRTATWVFIGQYYNTFRVGVSR